MKILSSFVLASSLQYYYAVVGVGVMTQNLDSGWVYRNTTPNNNQQWMPANVPSTVHMDLLQNG